MPDTLLILIISMLFFLLLAYLPIYFWIAEKNLTILNFVDGRHNLPEKGLKAKIATLAFENYKETYPIFLTLCTLGITMGIPLQHAALIWMWSRFIHAPSYIFNWKWIRTLSWHMSLLCLITMIFQIIFLNRLTMFTHF
jgi:uncharacterized MAPEG superfamily protein